MGAGTNITAGTDNVAIGAGAIVPGGVTSNVIVIGAGAYLPNMNSNQIRMGNTNISYAGIQVPWTITSDRSLKMDIHATPLGLEFIRELRPVGYARKNDANHSVEFGFIAQDIEALLEKNELKNSGMVSTDNL